MKKDKLLLQDFVDTLKDDPRAKIKWAKSEIECYKELIALVEKDRE